ncbi:MAG: tyrosine-type recombinase/integrase [Alphaproteobacteria bacterium]|nr:tyrosine-type recombinase/integrase [Alphaproteobacteria bacterium]NCQ89287.1 tyrosine-type recombinase/integrase [Alphaproteobacteria bacterium]NCT08151.1 tyrosine-type recombinase/integrase [Alphaproteobacteria bacterium]
MKLTNTACKSAQPKSKQYKRFDGGGLYLLVTLTGSKLWRLKYRYLGTEKVLAIGSYPEVSLADARKARDDAKSLLAKTPSVDPMTNKVQVKRKAVADAENTFEHLAREWHRTKNNQWTARYGETIMRRLEMNVFPTLGRRPISEITPPELLDCLRKIEKRGSYDVLKRTTQVCGQIFRYGIQTGRCERDAAADLKGALKSAPHNHFRTINLKQLPEFLEALKLNKARIFERTRRAVWLSLYTFCRPVEIRKAKWEHIDFKSKLWTIPASEMKMKRDHIVPLSNQVIELLKEQKEEVDLFNTEWVFPSQLKLKNPMSDGTVNKAIKRLGFGDDMVAHGFRALARTTIREELEYDTEVIEKQLAHKSAGSLGEAYNRTQFIDKRKAMMQDWADYIDRIGKA